MATLTDITATVSVPKSEYEDLIRQSEELKMIKNTMRSSSNTLPLVVLKHILGIEEGDKNEEIEITMRSTDGDVYHSVKFNRECYSNGAINTAKD